MGCKRKLLTFIFIAFSLRCFSQDVPELLKGVWKNSSRYVVFDSGYVSAKGGAVPHIVLRAFYAWYDDREAESSLYSESNPRDLNNTTARRAQEISVRYVPIADSVFSGNENSCGAWNLEVLYPGEKEPVIIPVAVIDEKLYLRFLVKLKRPDFSDDGENAVSGFWQDFGNVSGFTVSPPVSSRELVSYYVSDSAAYKIRYWKTDMEYDSGAKAFFYDGEEQCWVPRHLFVAGSTFTCVTGKRTKIRNVAKLDSFDESLTLNSAPESMQPGSESSGSVFQAFSSATICALGEPYLTLEKGKSLEEILAEDSKKHPPEPQPLFPPHGILDFDWSIIEDPPKDWNRRMLDLGK
ncbi:hypothetical protein [Treponema sp.]|uniref:hypothetical protein n=1 Tax=Treponema sp. TaxID=166 RepID=UPI003EFD0E57